MPFAKAMPGIMSAVRTGMGALRGGYASAGRGLASAGVSAMARGAKTGSVWGTRAGIGAGHTLGLAGDAASIVSKMGNTGMLATTGALAGGAYGAMSSDTSVLGGALMGAGLAVGGLGAARLGRRGLSTYNYSRGAGMAAGAARGQAFQAMGSMSRGFIGSSYARARNGWRAMSR